MDSTFYLCCSTSLDSSYAFAFEDYLRCVYVCASLGCSPLYHHYSIACCHHLTLLSSTHAYRTSHQCRQTLSEWRFESVSPWRRRCMYGAPVSSHIPTAIPVCLYQRSICASHRLCRMYVSLHTQHTHTSPRRRIPTVVEHSCMRPHLFMSTCYCIHHRLDAGKSTVACVLH